jgi:hypothetical protein
MNFINKLRLQIILGLAIIALGLNACKPDPKIAQLEKMIDLVAWKNDKGGCRNQRILMLDSLKAAKETIRGLDINDVTTVMGRPDMQVLTGRNQKFYVYGLEEGLHCQDIRQATQARTMALRFSALGTVTEVIFQRGKP